MLTTNCKLFPWMEMHINAIDNGTFLSFNVVYHMNIALLVILEQTGIFSTNPVRKLRKFLL